MTSTPSHLNKLSGPERDEVRRAVERLAAPAPPSAAPGSGGLPGGYQKLGLIGRGQFGAVWKGRAPGGVEVAIKLIRQADKDTTRRELQALELVKNLRHPHLLPIYAFWVDQ